MPKTAKGLVVSRGARLRLDQLPPSAQAQVAAQLYPRQTKECPIRPDPDPFLAFVKANGLPLPVPEYRFHPTRKWRFDWAFVPFLVAIEQEGAVWVQGRHTRGSGFVKDMEKYNAAAALGWRIIRVQPKDLITQQTLDLLRLCLANSDP